MVVLSLRSVGRSLRRPSPGHASHEQPRTRTDTGALVSAKHGSCGGSDYGADNGAAHAGIGCRLICRRTPYLIVGKLSAICVIRLKFREVLAGAR